MVCTLIDKYIDRQVHWLKFHLTATVACSIDLTYLYLRNESIWEAKRDNIIFEFLKELISYSMFNFVFTTNGVYCSKFSRQRRWLESSFQIVINCWVYCEKTINNSSFLKGDRAFFTCNWFYVVSKIVAC